MQRGGGGRLGRGESVVTRKQLQTHVSDARVPFDAPPRSVLATLRLSILISRHASSLSICRRIPDLSRYYASSIISFWPWIHTPISKGWVWDEVFSFLVFRLSRLISRDISLWFSLFWFWNRILFVLFCSRSCQGKEKILSFLFFDICFYYLWGVFSASKRGLKCFFWDTVMEIAVLSDGIEF